MYKAAADGLPTLADKGSIGAGIGIRIPVRRPKGKSEQALHVDTLMFSTLLRHVRALGERTAAELKQRWRTLQRTTLSPSRIGDIARAALVLNEAPLPDPTARFHPAVRPACWRRYHGAEGGGNLRDLPVRVTV
ncbi:transposase family protein [Streptantibioticus ferralitis]|uniref:Transposase family protein n=1 Tax=Streptantibioticus ferralitis TaxID=236510 RepID=A0ABT5Z140_9ACTN|nr:transposase family protein [Streptantibioticus ferralitis]